MPASHSGKWREDRLSRDRRLNLCYACVRLFLFRFRSIVIRACNRTFIDKTMQAFKVELRQVTGCRRCGQLCPLLPRIELDKQGTLSYRCTRLECNLIDNAGKSALTLTP